MFAVQCTQYSAHMPLYLVPMGEGHPLGSGQYWVNFILGLTDETGEDKFRDKTNL